MSLIATAKVVTRAEYYSQRAILQLGNWESVTPVESINASDWSLPPCVNCKGKTYIKGWLMAWQVIGVSRSRRTAGLLMRLVFDGLKSYLSLRLLCVHMGNIGY